MVEQIALESLLGIEGFDPLKIDVSEIQSLSEQVPKDGNIEINNAEVLAVKFLRGADSCSNLLGKIDLWSGNKKTEKDQAIGVAAHKLMEQKIPSTSIDKRYKEDENYVIACNAFTNAEAVKKWLERKYDNLIRAHHMCKDIQKRYMPNEKKDKNRPPEEVFDDIDV